MSPEASRRFTAHWPAIKAEWLKLLRGEPLLSPLGRPDTLVFLMDATLMQLQWSLENPEDKSWLDHCAPVAAMSHGYRACGRTPVTKYLNSGASALQNVGNAAFGPGITEVVSRFRALAEHELNALCSACPHPDWSGCELHRPPPPA